MRAAPIPRAVSPLSIPHWLRATVVAVALVAAGGCATSHAVSLARRGGGGATGYWSRSRLLRAGPLLGLGRRPGGAPAPGQAANAHTALLALRVGALFVRSASGDHFCTASVVASPGRDLLITAAHCINGGKGGGYRDDIVFVPGYRDGETPDGIWTPAKLVVAAQWISTANPDYDVGFVILAPQDGKNIEDILGANRLGIDSQYRYLVRVTGYPASESAPITCVNYTTRESSTQLRFDCGGFTGGTSGSPWVTKFDQATRTGTIVGVIGGYHQGGDTAAISYSSYLGPAVYRLYEQAVADEGTLAGSGG